MSIKRDLMKEKLFDPKLYNTLFINKEDEERVRREQMAVLAELICDDKHKAQQTDVYNLMKREKKAVDLLIRAIGETKENRKKLVGACWEANIDCDRHLSFFTNIVLTDDLSVAVEALTTIENMSGKTPAEEITACMKKAMESYKTQADTPKGQIIADLIEVLRKWQ